MNTLYEKKKRIQWNEIKAIQYIEGHVFVLFSCRAHSLLVFVFAFVRDQKPKDSQIEINALKHKRRLL